jgi:hypothetical protein
MPVAWCGQFLMAVPVLILLREYSSLLRAAAWMVARRAPVKSDD